jgi:hypothetical protein
MGNAEESTFDVSAIRRSDDEINNADKFLVALRGRWRDRLGGGRLSCSGWCGASEAASAWVSPHLFGDLRRGSDVRVLSG